MIANRTEAVPLEGHSGREMLSKHFIFNMSFLTYLPIRWCSWTGSDQKSVGVINKAYL